MMTLHTKKGFTLVEVLIVVVIIGILAALIIPRMLAAPEKAKLAEAKQMLGAIRRAEIVTKDSAPSTGYLALAHATSTDWSALGMVAPTSSPNFLYSCEITTNTCTAAKNDGSTATGSTTDYVKLGIEAGAFTCGGVYATTATGSTCIV